MRTLSVLLIASLLVAPALAAEDATIMHEECPDDLSTEEHAECHEEQDAPSLGVLASIGLLCAVAFVARRRSS